MSQKIALVRTRGQTCVYVDVEITDVGDLVFSGQETGEAPMRIFGDFDYEYWLSIKAEDKDRALLALMEKFYSGNESVVAELMTFLKAKGIHHEFSNTKTPIAPLDRPIPVPYYHAIWKRSPTTKTAMIEAVFESISNDRDHPAMAAFDVDALIRAFEAEFGQAVSGSDSPFRYSTGQGSTANWLLVSCEGSEVPIVIKRIGHIALQQGLMVYDPQRHTILGNKRPPKVVGEKTAKRPRPQDA